MALLITVITSITNITIITFITSNNSYIEQYFCSIGDADKKICIYWREQSMNDVIKADKRIKLNGNSLVVHLTSEVKLMGLGYNDWVRITLERVPEDEQH